MRRIPISLSCHSFSTSSCTSLPAPPSSRSPTSKPPPPPPPPQQKPSHVKPKPRAALSTQRNANEARFNYLPHSSPFDPTPPDPQSSSYRLVTAKELQRNKEPPKKVKMLVRELIDDCLYNPNYGYFSTKVDIFDPDSTTPTTRTSSRSKSKVVEEERAEGFEFGEFRNTAEFEEEVARRYLQFEGLDQQASLGTVGKGPGRQVWHTPTELFKVTFFHFVAETRKRESLLICIRFSRLHVY